ncbi:MAG: hypothetical protein V3R55_01415, partial [Alphaproteobacteria bacterium]
MRGLGYEAVFWRLRLVKVGLFVSGFAVAFLYVWINLLHVARRRPRPRRHWRPAPRHCRAPARRSIARRTHCAGATGRRSAAP